MEENKEKSQELKSDTVSFSVQKNPGCVVEYKVKTSPEIVRKSQQKAVKSVSKEVSLPGFRKGRAPDHLILKEFSQSVNERLEKALADETFRECQKLIQIPLLSDDTKVSFSIKKQSIQEGAEISLSFEAEPSVPDIDLSSIEIKEVQRETIDKKRLEQTLQDIQTYFVEWENISERNAQEGDFAVIDVDIIEKTPAENVLSNARFEIKKEAMAAWMHAMVLGMKVGDAKEGVSKPDEDSSKEDKESLPPKKVRLTLKRIELPKYPPIDDALAQKVGTQNEKELRERLEKLLNTQADEAVQKKYREQISTYLLDKYQFELPKTLLQKEMQFRVRQLIQDPSFQQKFMKMSEEKKKAAVKEVEAQGEKAVRLFYISRKIIKENNIFITPSEVHQGVSTPLEAMFSDQSDIYNANQQSQEQKAIATSKLILNKAEDFLISKAKVIPLKPEKKNAPKKAASQNSTPEKASNTKKAPSKKKSTEEFLT